MSFNKYVPGIFLVRSIETMGDEIFIDSIFCPLIEQICTEPVKFSVFPEKQTVNIPLVGLG